MIQEIYIIDDKKELTIKLQEMFKLEKEYEFKSVITHDIDVSLRSIPASIIIN